MSGHFQRLPSNEPYRVRNLWRGHLAALIAGVMIVAGSAAGAPALAQVTIVIKGAHTASEANAQHTPWAKFKEAAERLSNGAISVEIFPSAMMGNDNEIMEKVQLGALQMGNASSSNITNIVPEFGAFEIPYIITDVHDNMKLFYRDGKLGGPVYDYLNDKLLQKNLKLLWVTPASFRGIGAAKPITTPDDLNGLKIRSTASPTERASLQAFGANPVAMGFGEVYTALQQGTIDAEGLPPDMMYDSKHHEVVRHVLMNDYNTYFVVTAMDAKFYNNLSDEMRNVVVDAAVEAVEYANERWQPMLDDRIDKMKEAGVEVYYPTVEEMVVWKAKVAHVIDEYSKVIGSDFVATVRESLGSN